MYDLDLVTVATFRLRHEAEVARARLAAEGIPSVVHADDEGGLNPGFFAEYGVRLAVRSEQRAAAERVMADVADTSEVVTLHPEHLEALIAQAAFTDPEEACGLLAFDRHHHVRFVYCLTNAERSAYRFTVDPTEHFHALRHAERNGWEIAGDFHSHPRGDGRPSRTDMAAAATKWWVHIILGLRSTGDPDVRAFRIRDGDATELEIAVT